MSELFEKSWTIDAPRAAVVVVHGLGEHSGRYEHVARALNGAGYSVYARDVRGHGKSVGFPGDTGGDAGRLISDVMEHCSAVRESHDRVFLLAHSMGTLLSLPAAAELGDGTLAGLILSGCALEPGPAAADLMTAGAVPPETLSRDPEVVKAYAEDPLVWDSVPQEVMLGAIELGQRAGEAVPKIGVPVLLVHGTDDKLCDISGSSTVFEGLTVSDKIFKSYDGLFHEVLNEPEKDQVIADVIAWLDAH